MPGHPSQPAVTPSGGVDGAVALCDAAGVVGGRGWAALLVVTALAVAAGCSDDGDDGSGDGSSDGSGNAAAAASVHVVSQNLLHGITCPAETDGCDLPGRVELFLRQLDEGGCPELVGLQEANQRTVDVARGRPRRGRATAPTRSSSDDDAGLDREVVLTTLPVLGQRADPAGRVRCGRRCGCGWPPTSAWSTSCRPTSPAAATTGRATRRRARRRATVDGTVGACQGRQLLELRRRGRRRRLRAS